MVLHRVAHRGYSAVAPENTLPALAGAVLAGATLVEFDVRTTADGVPVVIHDRTVDRTTDGSGQVWDLMLDEVRALDAGSWFSPAFAGLRVPLLSEVLDLLASPLADSAAAAGVAPGPEAAGGLLPASGGVAGLLPASGGVAGLLPGPGGAAGLLLEIKAPATLEQVKAILWQVADRDLLARTVVQSFDPQVVALVREAAPDVRRGLLRLLLDDETVPLARDLGVVCCNPPLGDLLADPATVEALIAAGIDVMPWTANDRSQWAALVGAGVAGLITDRVGELTGWSPTAG
jgi:glycerophosphoryl diester phosphodiesterase